MRQIELEKLTSQQLDELLKAELAKQDIDREHVLEIMRILEERETNDPTGSPVDTQAVWEDFQKNRKKAPARRAPHRWIRTVAAVLAVALTLILIAPPAMGAENIFTLLGKWTADIFAFFNPYEDTEQQEYVFRTDHPGLQQIYDAVVEMGVTEPVVPMWVPDGYELVLLDTIQLPTDTKLYAQMTKNGEALSISISKAYGIPITQYAKDEEDAFIREISGIKHYVIQNEGKYVVAWVTDGTECSVIADCDRDTIMKIVDSVYTGG